MTNITPMLLPIGRKEARFAKGLLVLVKGLLVLRKISRYLIKQGIESIHK